jgi:hypothetical protein
MVSTRNETVIKSELVDYLSELGLDIHTGTKARGNNGFFRNGRIDVSKKLDDNSAIRVILHEFAHYVNSLLDEKFKNSFVLFNSEFNEFEEELSVVTNFVDENSLCKKLLDEREKVKKTIKNLANSIRVEYPNFALSEEFKPFKKYSRWSNVSYLEKHDRVKLINWFSTKIYSISNVKEDFPNIPEVFVHYLNLRSKQRKRARITSRISKLNKYYYSPTELFARFVEGLYVDREFVKELAPKSYERFSELYYSEYYPYFENVFKIAEILNL